MSEADKAEMDRLTSENERLKKSLSSRRPIPSALVSNLCHLAVIAGVCVVALFPLLVNNNLQLTENLTVSWEENKSLRRQLAESEKSRTELDKQLRAANEEITTLKEVRDSAVKEIMMYRRAIGCRLPKPTHLPQIAVEEDTIEVSENDPRLKPVRPRIKKRSK